MEKSRIIELDILRGIALLGVFVVNVQLLGFPGFYIESKQYWLESIDQKVLSFLYLFAEGKFISIFSFLFGYGFVIFIQNAKNKSEKATVLFYRRIGILFLIGIIHGSFIWYGDVLLIYSILGFVMYFIITYTNDRYLKYAFLLCVFPVISFMGLNYIDYISQVKEGVIESVSKLQKVREIIHIYGSGSLIDILKQNAQDRIISLVAYLLISPQILAMFLIGAYASSVNLFANIKENKLFIYTVFFYSFLIGFLAIMGVYFVEKLSMNDFILSSVDLFNTYLISPILSISYICGLLLLFLNKRFLELMFPFQMLGQMALSNYIFQSVFCVYFFYSFGVELYGIVSPVLLVIMSLSIFLLQLVFSCLWMEKFKYGPLEWLWRMGTYQKYLSLKREK